MPGNSSSTTTQKSEPWDGQKPYILEGYKEAQDIYNKGPAQYFPGSTVAGFGSQTENALNAIYNQGITGQAQRAGAQNAVNQFSEGNLGNWGAVDQLRNLGAANNYQQDQGVQNIMGLAGRGTNLARNFEARTGDLTQTGGGSNSQIRNDTYDLITGVAQANNPAFNQLQKTASGAYLGSNPNLDAMYGRAAAGLTRNFAEGVAPGLDSSASRAGRYGSGMHRNVKDAAGESFGRTLGDLATSMYGGAYDTERARQDAAASTLGSQYLQGQGLRASTAAQSADQASRDAQLRLAASGQMQNAEQQDIANFMAANDRLSQAYNTGADRQLQTIGMGNDVYNQARQQQLQALGMQPAYQQMGYTDLNAASAAGAQRDQLAQQQLNDQIARFDFGQNSEWQNLQRYMAMINGGSPGATTSITQSGNGMGGLASLFAGAGGLGQLAMGTRGLLW